jgi:hypothetical protein
MGKKKIKPPKSKSLTKYPIPPTTREEDTSKHTKKERRENKKDMKNIEIDSE